MEWEQLNKQLISRRILITKPELNGKTLSQLKIRNNLGRETGFMMKKDWFFWPLGPIFRWMGGIPVDRSRKTSLVDQMIKIAKSSQKFHLAITPEGTRKANPNWKKGFYYIAQGAGLPIILVAIDYEKKCITAEKVIHPSGDLDKDMREIKLYYKNFKGKYPEIGRAHV